MNFPELPKFDVPLFDGRCIYLCRSKDEWVNAHQFFGITAEKLDRKGAANTFQSLSGQQDIHLLGVFDGQSSTLAHEAAHIIFDICHLVGIDVETSKANETFCYLLDSVMRFAEPYIKKPAEIK
ncbi:hypothetical protein [Rodentibacter haemolyticus]|uniref:Uncharacterized protein n=1 Tax=Rodentibacter haemolyticus TaxID=2778911 RepID=A0ABX6UWK3_9PAST|nr:hypothetical protein [Rodentibacter haemolyticus]QPB42217.1 hypothetical protein IHV77_09940 [Rodentibacter haemolyticus]